MEETVNLDHVYVTCPVQEKDDSGSTVMLSASVIQLWIGVCLFCLIFQYSLESRKSRVTGNEFLGPHFLYRIKYFNFTFFSRIKRVITRMEE